MSERMAERTGAGDPARTLELLWRHAATPSVRSRGPRPTLSVDRIVRAAIDLADAEGLDRFSMRRVAQCLGVTAMTLYTYVPGKAELVDLMTDTVYGEMERPAPDRSQDWRARLETVARQNRLLHDRHPWLDHVVTGRPPLGPHVMAKYEYELNALAGVEVSDVDKDSVLTLILEFVQGAARSAHEAQRTRQQTGMNDEEWWTANEPLLSRIFDPRRYPTAVRVGTAAGTAHGSAYDPDHAFEFGLQRVLDGIGAFIDR